MHRKTALTLIIATALATAACTSTQNASPPSSTDNSSLATDSAEHPVLSTTIPGGTPFSPYFAVIADLAARRTGQAVSESLHREQEEQIASCMHSLGFEYEPEPYSPPQDQRSAPWATDTLSIPALAADRTEVARVGYGIHDVETEERARLAQVDSANTPYVSTLSDQAQAEYYAALIGVRGPDDPSPDAEGGCAGRAEQSATTQTPSDPSAAVSEQYGPLVSAMGDLRLSVLRDDPRTLALDGEWTACMADLGWDLRFPEEPDYTPNPVNAYNLATETPPGGVADPPALGVPYLADDIPVEERYLVGSDEESAIALADFDCRASVGYLPRLTDILTELEGRFVAEHERELDEFRSAVALLTTST